MGESGADMKLLVTKSPALEHGFTSSHEEWLQQFFNCEDVVLAVGYTSHDSLLYLSRLVELNSEQRVTLCIGLARTQGMTRLQRDAASRLDGALRSAGRGGVFVAHQVAFHGKVSVFGRLGAPVAAIVGSSNLGSLTPPLSEFESRYMEIDLAIDSASHVHELSLFLTRLVNECSIPYADAAEVIPVVQVKNDEFYGREDVQVLSATEAKAIYNARSESSFELELKTEAKSNLNAYFGKGRENRQGHVRPRNWYEVDVIVTNTVTSKPDYPRGKDFLVCTDDGYIFACKVSGTNHKNFRSRGDLTVLGRWIKGRLEANGVLRVGDPVTEETLLAYGRDALKLTKTPHSREFVGEVLPVWTLDFSRPSV
jgi:hypothetical protein